MHLKGSAPVKTNVKYEKNLKVLLHLNDAYCCVFDNKFKDAVEAFRNVLLEVPGNPVAANNIATCHVFNNMADKALETLSDLIKMPDTLNTVNEQILSNIKELCRVQYADKESDDKYNRIVSIVSKNAKDSVCSMIMQQNAINNAAKK